MNGNDLYVLIRLSGKLIANNKDVTYSSTLGQTVFAQLVESRTRPRTAICYTRGCLTGSVGTADLNVRARIQDERFVLQPSAEEWLRGPNVSNNIQCVVNSARCTTQNLFNTHTRTHK